MATELTKSIAFSLGSVVNNAITTAKKVKAQELAVKEAEFQAAVADGSMSYQAQLEYRERQLSEERSSVLPDADFILNLEQSISNTKKLNRFSKYRLKYQNSFASLQAGRRTAEQHLEILRDQLSRSKDPELQLEIQTDIAEAENQVAQYQANILNNQVKRAQYDGSSKVLKEAIQKVNDRKALAALNGNEEEVTALETTVTVLQQQLNSVEVEDKIDDIQVRSVSGGLSSVEKLQELNDAIFSGDATSPVTINNKVYDSVQAYWTATRDAYLSGTGTGIFSDFFAETQNDLNSAVNAGIARDGFATTVTLDIVKNSLEALKAKPELVNFVDRLDQMQVTTIQSALQSTGTTIIDRANYNGDFKGAEQSIKDYSARYGVDMDAYLLVLGNNLATQINRVAGQTGKSPAQVAAEEGVTEILKAEDFDVPTPTTDAPAAPVPARQFTDKENADLNAAEARIQAGTGTAVDKQNVDYAKSKGWKAGAVTPTSTTPTATPPVNPAPPAPRQFTDQEKAGLAAAEARIKNGTASAGDRQNVEYAKKQGYVSAPAPAPVPAQTTPATPTTPAPTTTTPTVPKSTYNGTSVVDYLKSQNKDASYASRSALAKQYGIQDYTGSIQQNSDLLTKLRGS